MASGCSRYLTSVTTCFTAETAGARHSISISPRGGWGHQKEKQKKNQSRSGDTGNGRRESSPDIQRSHPRDPERPGMSRQDKGHRYVRDNADPRGQTDTYTISGKNLQIRIAFDSRHENKACLDNQDSQPGEFEARRRR